MTTPSLWESVQGFLFKEALLLDHWKLKEWTDLYTEDGRYLVPPLNVANPEKLSDRDNLFLIADDRAMLEARAERLLKKSAHVENPRSHIRHMMSNVLIISADQIEIEVASNFCVYRIRRGEIGSYIGEYRHRLVQHDETFRIREKRVCLDLDRLEPQGSLGIIL